MGDCDGVIPSKHMEKASLTVERCVVLLDTLHAALKGKSREKLSKRIIFLQDNAPSHKTIIATQKLVDL